MCHLIKLKKFLSIITAALFFLPSPLFSSSVEITESTASGFMRVQSLNEALEVSSLEKSSESDQTTQFFLTEIPLSTTGEKDDKGAREIVTLSVTDFGADSSDEEDDSNAFRLAAEEAARWVREKGVHVRIYVPPGEGSYIIGSGVGHPETLGQAIQITSNVYWSGIGVTDGRRAKLKFNGARTSSGQSRVFVLNDPNAVEGVTISGFEIDGGSQVAVGISLEGVVKNITIHDVSLLNFHNFAIQYADSETDSEKAYFENVVLNRVTVGGSVNPISGKGSGINFFARTTMAEGGSYVPRSTGLYMNDVQVDVSNASARVSDHGPQAIKVNGVRGGIWENVSTVGGQIAGVNITNGARDLFLKSIHTEKAASGLYLTTTGNTTVSILTQHITVEDFTFRHAGVTNASGIALSAKGVDINGSVHDVSMKNVDIEGHFEISESPQVQVKVSPAGVASGWIRGDIINFPGGTAEVVAFENEYLRLARVSGVLEEGVLLNGPGGTATAEIVDYLNSPERLRLENIRIHDGRFYVRNTANSTGQIIRDLQIRNITFTGSHPSYGQIILGGKKRWLENSTITGITSYRPQSEVIVDTYGKNNVFEFANPFLSLCSFFSFRSSYMCAEVQTFFR